MGDCCSEEKCCCPCHREHEENCCSNNHNNEGEFGKWLIEAADCAWMEVLKDKIKEHIESTQGDRMKELAKIVSETNSMRWKNKMEKKRGKAEFKEKLRHFFEQSKK